MRSEDRSLKPEALSNSLNLSSAVCEVKLKLRIMHCGILTKELNGYYVEDNNYVIGNCGAAL
jgi:hypothetical protein